MSHVPKSQTEPWLRAPHQPCPVQLPVGFRSIRPDALTELNRQSELRGRCLRFQHAELEIHGKPARDARAADEYERTTYAGGGDAAYLADRFMPRPTATGKASGEQAQHSTDSRAVRFASRYKLVFSLLNEDVGRGGVKDWEVTPALESGWPSLALRPSRLSALWGIG